MTETHAKKLWRPLEEFDSPKSAAKVPRLYRDGDDAASRARAREIEDLKKEQARLEQELQRSKSWAEDCYRGLNIHRDICKIKDLNIDKLKQDLAAAAFLREKLEGQLAEANESRELKDVRSLISTLQAGHESDVKDARIRQLESDMNRLGAENDHLWAHQKSLEEELKRFKESKGAVPPPRVFGTPQYIQDIDFTNDLDRMANRTLMVIRVPKEIRIRDKVPFWMAELSKPFGQFKDGEPLTGRWAELNGVTYQLLDQCPLKASRGNTKQVVLGAVAQLPSCRAATGFFTDLICRRFPAETSCA